jgi:hypothetical protein
LLLLRQQKVMTNNNGQGNQVSLQFGINLDQLLQRSVHSCMIGAENACAHATEQATLWKERGVAASDPLTAVPFVVLPAVQQLWMRLKWHFILRFKSPKPKGQLYLPPVPNNVLWSDHYGWIRSMNRS